jgi:N-acetylglucosaminyldiphosphoundecaprenol N-acetyl-beta-D-mannosaminyltransferase
MDHQVVPNVSVAQHDRDDAVFKVLGVRINAVQIPQVVAQMERWISRNSHCHLIAVTGMHGVMEAQHDPALKKILNSADLVVPDGMPLVWLGRRHHYPLRRRVYGPELMQTFCRVTGARYRHFFYGALPGVSTRLAETLRMQFGICAVGAYSPPFRPLSREEDNQMVDIIHKAKPDVLWVGLSTPKQEHWMYVHKPVLQVPVIVGVGAAFDFNSGRIRQAPGWMREHGLECVFRLLQEPRRLWRRYLVYGSEFVWDVTSELLHVRKFD